MVIVLRDGEEIHGMIEWYDKSCLKVARNGQTNLLIYKPAIKYMFKEGENRKRSARRTSDLEHITIRAYAWPLSRKHTSEIIKCWSPIFGR